MDKNNSTNKRIINVSNRLPVKITATAGGYEYKASEGGLATGLSAAFARAEHIWIGWPGAAVPEHDCLKVTQALEAQKLKPVFLNTKEIENYYEGFSNGTLWPLFHYFPSYSNYDSAFWESYVAVNKKFADAILEIADASDTIWIHDYQLMLVPAMVRSALPGATVGYFHHIPFPAYEVLRALPSKKELVAGLLGADTIGFQTEEDANYFREAAVTLSSCIQHEDELLIDDRKVQVAAFPISIDYKKFENLASEPETLKAEEKIRGFSAAKLMISVDRLDYSKGILQRLRAYDAFLQRHPEWCGKVTLVHLIVPSRDNVCNYKELKHQMDRLVSEINGKYSTLDWQPIHHFYRSFTPNMLSAIYKNADVALVTPLRDGMNLVCKEFIASNISAKGVLVLGEAAGAAKALTGAIQINPNDTEAFCKAIHQALTMPKQERRDRMRIMQANVRHNDINYWMNSFMQALHKKSAHNQIYICTPLSDQQYNIITHNYQHSFNRLFLLDYDGTMMPLQRRPELVVPDKELLHLLHTLGTKPGNKVVIISGRDRHTMERWLGQLPVDLVAEHGAFYKEQHGKWLRVPGLTPDWKNDVKHTLDTFSSKIPGSFVEEKSYSMAWHYREADKKLAEDQLPTMVALLQSQVEHQGLNILQGDKVLEVKSTLVNKGKAATAALSRYPSDFILAAGDDVTDEYMFRALYGSAITIKIGSNISAATYCMKSFEQLRQLLGKLAAMNVNSNQLMIAG